MHCVGTISGRKIIIIVQFTFHVKVRFGAWNIFCLLVTLQLQLSIRVHAVSNLNPRGSPTVNPLPTAANLNKLEI